MKLTLKTKKGGFPGGTVVKNLPANSGDTGLIPGQGTKIPQATAWPKNQTKPNKQKKPRCVR